MPTRLPRPALLLALAVVAAGPATAQEGRPLQPDEGAALAALAAGEDLAACGRFRDAIATVTSALLLSPPGPTREAITLSRFAVEVAAVASHVAGKDSGLRQGEDDGPPDHNLIAGLLLSSLQRDLLRLKEGLRPRVLADPRLRLLVDTPGFRYERHVTWKEPRAAVWPDAPHLETANATFDALFSALAGVSPAERRPEVRAFARANDEEGKPMPQALRRRLLRGLLDPIGDPLDWKPEVYRFSPDLARSPASWPLELAEQVGPAVACGDGERALAHLDRLREADPYLHDFAVDQAWRVVNQAMQDGHDEGMYALHHRLMLRRYGLPERERPSAGAYPEAVTRAIAEAAKERAAGRLVEAMARLEAARPIASASVRAASRDLQVARLEVWSAGVERYEAGQDAGLVTAAQREKAGVPPDDQRLMAARVVEDSVRTASEVDFNPQRDQLCEAPGLERLRRTPRFRMLRSESWRQPREAVWPGAHVASGDAAFDAVFGDVARIPVPPKGMEVSQVVPWLDRRMATRPEHVADVWLFGVQRAMVSPRNHGGWPTRMGLLQDPDAVKEVLAELDRRAEGTLVGFAAACAVNLAIAAGDAPRALALMDSVLPEDEYLSDFVVTQAEQMLRWMKEQKRLTPAHEPLLRPIRLRMAGVVEAAPPAGERR